MGGAVGPRQHGLLAALLVGRGEPASRAASPRRAERGGHFSRLRDDGVSRPGAAAGADDARPGVPARSSRDRALGGGPVRARHRVLPHGGKRYDEHRSVLQLHPPAVGAGGGRRDAYTSASGGGAASGGVGSPRASGTSWWNRLDSRM